MSCYDRAGFWAHTFVCRVPHFFNQDWAKDFGYQITLSLSFQLVGYGLAGLTRRFLVYPAAGEFFRMIV